MIRLHSFSHAKCVTSIKLCVRPLSLKHSNTNHKTNSKCSGSGLASFDHDDFSGIKYYCVIRSCENECMYSWQVKFNNEIIYYRHLTYSILTHLSLKWLFFCLGIPKKFQEHYVLAFSLLHVNRTLYIHIAHMCSWFNKGCFGHWELINSKLLFGGHSGKSLHCLVCPNAQ